MDIIYSVLMAVRRSNPAALPTHIMYRSNLSYQLLGSYLEFLLVNGLIRSKTIDGKQLYDITDKGQQFIGTYERLRSILESQ